MASAKVERRPEEVEDFVLRRVFQVTVVPPADHHGNLIYLEQVAAELLSESRPILLNRDLMERVLMDRLSTLYPGCEPPFMYLVGCYRRAVEESRKVQNMKNKKLMADLVEVFNQAKELTVSYAGIMLIHKETFPQPPKVVGQDFSPLLTLILNEANPSSGFEGSTSSATSSHPGTTLPAGFLDQMFKRFDGEGLDSLLDDVFQGLRSCVFKVSPFGLFQKPLGALVMLVSSYPIAAKTLVHHKTWHPKGNHVNGRVLEVATFLGAYFHISVIPDFAVFGNGEPDVGQQCFSDAASRRPADIMSSYATIKTVMHQLYDGLHEVLLKLLKYAETREPVLQLLADIIEKNAARSQMQVNPLVNASTGMFVNLSAVMLKLCEPFLDPSSSKKDKIDLNYVLRNIRVDFSKLTAIHATSEELANWVDKRNYARIEGFRQAQLQREQEEMQRLQSENASSSAVSSSPRGVGSSFGTASTPPMSYSFICECFFLTARVLNLGLLKALSDFKNLIQDISRQKDSLNALKAMRGGPASSELEREIEQAEATIKKLSQDRFCYDAQLLRDTDLLQQGITYYKLMIVWLVSLVGGFRYPLPAQCPMEFASMPEHFVEDAMELLLFAARVPKALDGILLDDFMSFIVMFMGSPLYVKNPYLRAKMVEVLNAWMPSKSYMPTSASSMASLFEGHPLAMDHLVPNLLKLYVDIEFTGSHTQFYDKFNIRHNIAELLEYLWNVPSHHNAWKRIAVTEERSFYLKFLNLLINDSIFLLDESLKKIPELKEMEAEQANVAEWERRPAQERQERTRAFHQTEQMVRIDMTLANEDVKMLQYTTVEITSPFLLPEMVERIASMLNYFLLQLVITQRKALKLTHPEKYEFKPKELLAQIADIYVNIARGDSENVFPKAICCDGRSYRDELFSEAAGALRQIGLPESTIREFMALGSKAKAAAVEALDAEALLGEIPDEFLDPIQYTLMRDPVILPSSKATLDRATIQRHLLSDQTDPFNRSLLTPDMLIPDTELKARIDEFLNSRRMQL